MKIGVYVVKNDPLPKLLKLKEVNITKEQLKSYEDIVEIFNNNLSMDKLSSENIYALSLTFGMNPKGIIHVASGKCDSCDADLRGLAIGLLLTGAEQFICFHNHPGGNKAITDKDIQLTKTYREIGDLIGIKFLNHIMITQNYFDYCDDKYDEIPFV